jgi:hypothetical protein
MLRTAQFACSLPKEEADVLNAESGRVYTNMLVQHYRRYRKQGIWLSQKSGERMEDAVGGPTTLHAHIVYMLRDFEDGVAIVTFHPQVIGRGHRLLALERWLEELRSMGVAFARCENIARQVLAGRAYGTYRPATDR